MWRRVQYGTGFAAFWCFVALLVYVVYFYEPAGCFDGIQNADERGVDCGGACVRICAFDVMPPVIDWAESFKIVDGQYNAVAYVENRNDEAATPELQYTFELLDGDDVIAQRSGETVLPPNGVYPIFEGRILTEDDREPTDTRITIRPSDLWIPATLGREQFQTRDIELLRSGVRPRLNVVIENTELRPADDVEVVATIFNDDGVPLTASETFIEELPGRGSEDIVFTWPEPIAQTVTSCIVPTDVVVGIDLSGSMNNDGGTPAEPIASARAAAANFVDSLQRQDQVSVVTFASDAALRSPLSTRIGATADEVRRLEIDPAEEQGFTNTAAALRAAGAELSSDRVNPDARRVLVLLTDGLPTAPDSVANFEQTVLEEAARLAEQNIRVYAIGLGEAVNRQFVNGLASAPDNAFIAPDRSDLQAIYDEVSTSLCEVGPSKIDVLPKTDANFVPLRGESENRFFWF